MAVINKRVDDYMYNSKGEEVEGAKKRTLTIPPVMFGGKRSVKHTLDTSDKGDKALDREYEKLQERIQKECALFLKNIGFDVEKYTAKQSDEDEAEDQTTKAPEPEDTDSTPDEAPDGASEDLSDEDLEAATSPSEPNVGSNY